MNTENAKLRGSLNPTPISKLLVTIFLSFNLTAEVGEIYAGITILIISMFFFINGRQKTAVKSIIFYIILNLILYNSSKVDIEFLQKYFFIFFVFIKIFFVPIYAGKLLIDTSDVSSMIVSFEKLKIPKVIVIPLAVIFRYFPAYRDDKKNIKMAMKMRGISHKNPIRYLEYVSVPILISATNIADDISKTAETKCIADPCEKIRYKEVKFSIIDLVYIVLIVSVTVLGRIYA